MSELSKTATDYNLIMIELTNCCNLDCEYCYRSRMNLKGRMLTGEELLFRLERIKEGVPILFCGMGEQITHPQFYELLKLASGHQIQLVTNGTIDIDVERLIALNNVYSITISVDGPDAATASKSCSHYKFDVLTRNLERLSRQKSILTAINFVLSKDNMDAVFSMADFSYKYNVSALNLLLPTTDMKWVRENYDRIYELLAKLKKYVTEQNYNLFIGMPDTMFCMFKGKITPYISVEGYVRPCCSHDRGVNVVGRIQKNTMDEIMKGKAWKAFIDEFDCNRCSMNQFHFAFKE